MRHTYFYPDRPTKAPGKKAPTYELLLVLNAGLPTTEKPTFLKN
jgi:hypothetical protein